MLQGELRDVYVYNCSYLDIWETFFSKEIVYEVGGMSLVVHNIVEAIVVMRSIIHDVSYHHVCERKNIK